MNIHKTSWMALLAFSVSVVGATLAPSVQAQTTLGDLLNRVRNGAPQQAAPQTSVNGQLPSGLQPSAVPSKPVESVLWSTKADFLAATRNGDLIAVDRIAYMLSAELEPVTISIAAILHSDYGVALPFSVRDIRKRSDSCALGFIGDVAIVLKAVTELHAKTLSQEPPDFYKDSSNDSIHDVDTAVKVLGRGNYCDQEFLGAKKPHPYKAALLKLMDEYGQATKDYVEAERGHRKTAYAEKQTLIQAEQKTRADAQAKRDVDARAAEQHRIDEEQARIQSEQKAREKQEQNRVGG